MGRRAVAAARQERHPTNSVGEPAPSTPPAGRTLNSYCLGQWLKVRQGEPEEPLFPTRQGQPLTRSGIGQLLAKHAATAAIDCPSLKTKDVSPHTLRHTNAMLLRAGEVDIATIALWLGHESIKTTRIYEHADPKLKEQAIARIAPLGTKPGRYRPTDTLLAFLEGL